MEWWLFVLSFFFSPLLLFVFISLLWLLGSIVKFLFALVFGFWLWIFRQIDFAEYRDWLSGSFDCDLF